MKFKAKKLGTLLIIGLVFPLIINNTVNFRDDQKTNLETLKQSNGLTFIHVDGSNPNNWTWTAGNYSWCYFDNGYYIIENVTMDASSSPTGSGIYIENSKYDYFIIRNCTVNYAGSAWSDGGIKLVDTCNGTIFNNTVSDNYNYGIYLNNYCDNNTILENIINDNDEDGIYLYEFCDLNNITGNTINSNNQHGIYLRITCWNNNIINNTANGNDYGGIFINLNSDFNNIINNTVNYNGDTGISVYSGSIGNTITNNTVNDNLMHGIKISVSDENDVYDNTVNHNGYIGIDLDYQSDNNNIKNNTINRNDLGINLYYSDYNNISGNTLEDNNWCIYETYCTGNIFDYNDCSPSTINQPIFIDGDATGVGAHNWTWAESQTWCSGSGTDLDPYIIENLKISGFGFGDGIEILDSNVSFIIQECSIYNSHTGIYLDNVNNSRLINNNCSNNGFGISVELSTNNLISGNTANGNDYEGISLSACDYSNITGNTANDNNEYGIRIDESANNTISGNTANGNDRKGIYLEDSDYNNITGNIANDNTFQGILLEEGNNNNTIAGNIFNNNQVGIDIYYSDYNSFIDNIVNNNNYNGIELEESNYNTIMGNILKNNTLFGMYVEAGSNNNSIFKNFFLENGNHALDDGTDNKWNSTIIGNYWDNHTGPDLALPYGIVDIPYNISGYSGSKDNLPIADDSPPVIIINSPYNNYVRGTNAPTYDVTITDDYFYEMWYTLDGGLHNYTFIEFTGTIEQSAWDSLVDGSTTLTFYASDMPGNIGSIDVIIVKDTTGPVIVITSPFSEAEFGVNAPAFIIIVTDDHLDSIWYSFEGSLINYTITTNTTIDQTAWAFLPGGSITITFYANDTLGNLSFEEVTITKSIPPGGEGLPIEIIIIDLFLVGGVVVIAVVIIFIKRRKTPE